VGDSEIEGWILNPRLGTLVPMSPTALIRWRPVTERGAVMRTLPAPNESAVKEAITVPSQRTDTSSPDLKPEQATVTRV
jgi:hypothetical protein